MKPFITLVLLASSSVSLADVSNDSWEAFCAKQTEQSVVDYCVKVDQVCELVGYESNRCDTARQDAMKKPAHPGGLEK